MLETILIYTSALTAQSFSGPLGLLVSALYVCKALNDVNGIPSISASTSGPKNCLELV